VITTKLCDFRPVLVLSLSLSLARAPASVQGQYLTAITAKENLSYCAGEGGGWGKGSRVPSGATAQRTCGVQAHAQITPRRVSVIDLPVAGARRRNEFSSAILSGRAGLSAWFVPFRRGNYSRPSGIMLTARLRDTDDEYVRLKRVD